MTVWKLGDELGTLEPLLEILPEPLRAKVWAVTDLKSLYRLCSGLAREGRPAGFPISGDAVIRQRWCQRQAIRYLVEELHLPVSVMSLADDDSIVGSYGTMVWTPGGGIGRKEYWLRRWSLTLRKVSEPAPPKAEPVSASTTQPQTVMQPQGSVPFSRPGEPWREPTAL